MFSMASSRHKIRDYQFLQKYDVDTNTTTDQNSICRAAVNEYTSRDLTKPSDKLPAIRGLALYLHDRYMSSKAKIRYVMGHWANKMIAGLLCYVDLGADREKQKEYHAPTWSWASIEGVVSNHSLNLDDDGTSVQILDSNLVGNELSRPVWLQDKCSKESSLFYADM